MDYANYHIMENSYLDNPTFLYKLRPEDIFIIISSSMYDVFLRAH